jgi:predicted SAM-dependent methyltransferase
LELLVITFQDYPTDQPLRIILGAGEQQYPGWIATQREDLDLLRPDLWKHSFGPRRVDAFLCEHVWEHLTEAEGRAAARLCFAYLRPGGYIRCAVPDAYFPDSQYRRNVQVGGPGPQDHPAADHKIVYTYTRFQDVFAQAGFGVDLLEYCDENGRFHFHQWDVSKGKIYRSLRFDHRNQTGELHFVSLILDAIKPA